MRSRTRKPKQVWVVREAERHERAVFMLVASVAVVVGLVIYEGFWRRNLVLELILVGVIVLLGRAFYPFVEGAERLRRGADSEVAVSTLLRSMAADGFQTIDDIDIGWGNIDHLVSGPTGVFMIETKHRQYDDRDIPKAKGRARRAYDEIGVFVTPVICLEQRTSPKTYLIDGVWVIPKQALVGWIGTQRNKPADSARISAFADAYPHA